MNCVKGKKLLVLGGVQPACQIVQEAQKMGVIVYVTDYLDDSPAKKLADKSFSVSVTDVDAVVDLCKKESVNGIITGYIDSILPYYIEICEKLNFYHWGNADNINMCINKETFKLACCKSGLPVVPWKKLKEDELDEELFDIEMPVVVKPVDNSGSRGVYKCYKRVELRNACIEAFKFSKAKEILIEELMDLNNEFSVYYILHNGKPYISAMGDRYVNVIDEKIAPVGQGMLYPSAKLSLWKEKLDSKIQEFFKDNDMENGFVFVQGFTKGEEFFIHEIGYRLNGGFTYKFIDHYSGYNQVQELIRFSLTGQMSINNLEKSNPMFNGYGFILTISLGCGTINQINGVDKIEGTKGVLEFCQLHFEGDRLLSKGTTSQVFAYILCAVNGREQLEKVVDEVNKNLQILDEDNNNMLNDVISVKRINFS